MLRNLSQRASLNSLVLRLPGRLDEDCRSETEPSAGGKTYVQIWMTRALRDGVVPPALNLKDLDPEIDLDVVAAPPRPGDYRYAVQ